MESITLNSLNSLDWPTGQGYGANSSESEKRIDSLTFETKAALTGADFWAFINGGSSI